MPFTVYLLLYISPPPPGCRHVLSLALSPRSQFLCSNRKPGRSARATDNSRSGRATRRKKMCNQRYEMTHKEKETDRERKSGDTARLLPLCKCLHVLLKSVRGLRPKHILFCHQRPRSPTTLSVAFGREQTRLSLDFLHEPQCHRETALK